MLSWVLVFRAASLVISSALYFIIFLHLYWIGSKEYIRYYSKVRFVLKTLLFIFYCVLGVEFNSLALLTPFHILVLVLLVLLDIADMWSRSYRTYGFKELKKTIGKAAYFFV